MTDIYKDGKFQTLMKKNITNPCSNELFKHTANNTYNGMINENCTVFKVK